MIWPGVSLLPRTGSYVPNLDEAGRLHMLTFQQPYGSACVDGPKRAENRTWRVSKHLWGRALWVGVHAGLGWYDGADASIQHWRAMPGTDHRSPDYRAWPTAPSTRNGYPKACLLGFVRVVGCYDLEEVAALAVGRKVASASLRAEAQRTMGAMRAWAFGPVVWRLDPVAIRLPKPIPVPRGALGLWALDDGRAKMPVELQATIRRALVSCLYNRETWRIAA